MPIIGAIEANRVKLRWLAYCAGVGFEVVAIVWNRYGYILPMAGVCDALYCYEASVICSA